MDKILESQFNFTSAFFNNAIEKNKLFHSYLLTGNNNVAKYAFALNIARILNCTGDKTEDCNCLNCKWIKSNSHPAVMTFSPIDFIHINNGQKAKDRITVNQARFIKDELAKTSTYHRVIIITDAIEGKEAERDYEYLKKFNIKAPAVVGENDTERIWVPKSLNVNIFARETANTMLKTIEEPFDNVTFFFFANSTEDMLPTIVSRCQVVNLLSSPRVENDFSVIEKIINNYPAKDNLTSIMLAEHIKKISKENGLTILEILDLIKNFYLNNLQNYMENTSDYKQILIFLNKIENSEMQIKRYVDIDSVLENLFYI